MPIFAYRCGACGFEKDALQKRSDPPLTQCPSCGEDALRKQVTAPAFQLKGSGWYATDFRDGGKPKPADGKAAEEKGGEGKGGEGKAGEGKAGEGKAGEGKAGETASAPGSRLRLAGTTRRPSASSTCTLLALRAAAAIDAGTCTTARRAPGA